MKSSLLILLALFTFSSEVKSQDLADYDYENLSFRGVGLDYGYIWPNRVVAAPMFSMRLDLGYLGPGVRIAPSISYWSSNLRDAELRRFAERLNRLPTLQERGVTLTAAELGTIQWSDVSVSLDAQYVWTTPLDVMTYLGAGIAVHGLNGQGSAIADTFVEDLLDSFSAGVAAIGGLEYEPLPRFRMYGEVRFNFLSDVTYPAIRLGGAFMLAQTGRGDAPAQRTGPR